MSLLLLPRLGNGNAVPFNNNFTVTKDGNPWSDGGGDTFDSTSGVQVSTANGWTMLGGTAYTSADGLIQSSKALGSGAVDIGVYAGWAIAGLFACEVELGFSPQQPLQLRFACNTGYDNGSPTGVVTTSFNIGSNAYELKTAWITFGGKDSWSTTSETQLTVTMVPFLAAQNAPGANPFAWSGSGDDRDFRLPAVQRGATVYIQWGKVSVDTVQGWIIGDLVESDEFASSPHARLQLEQTAPRCVQHELRHLNSPNSDLWSQPGSHPRQHRGVATSRRNIHFGGNGQITGTVKEKSQPDQPLVRRVQLVSENTRVLVAETWSDATGAYRFDLIDPNQRYTVVSYDHKQMYRAVIADNLRPEMMP